jgi:hypothetical protein
MKNLRDFRPLIIMAAHSPTRKMPNMTLESLVHKLVIFHTLGDLVSFKETLGELVLRNTFFWAATPGYDLSENDHLKRLDLLCASN